MVTRRELNEGKRRTKGRGGEGLGWREGKFVMCCRMSVSAQASTFFSRIGQPYRTTHAFPQDKACLDDPIISIRPCRDPLYQLPEDEVPHTPVTGINPCNIEHNLPLRSNSRLLASPVKRLYHRKFLSLGSCYFWCHNLVVHGRFPVRPSIHSSC